jgi:hypothetical protein
MSVELQSLRAEMLKWQDRRFDLLKHSTGVVTGLLGFKLIAEQSGVVVSAASAWPLISAVLLLYLSAANLLTWYAGIANSKLASYIKVFHEDSHTENNAPRWESRLASLKRKGLDPQSLNLWITVVYFVLGLVSVALPLTSAGFATPDKLWLAILLISSVPFLATLVLVAWYSYPRQRYEAHWLQLKREEQENA